MFRSTTCFAALAMLAVSAGLSQAVTIEWVTVEDPNNAPDVQVMGDGTRGYGAVEYAYRISKYEVTNGQYRELLNAVAKTDTYELYSGSMHSSPFGGITQTGTPGNYVYLAKDGDPNWDKKPVSFVTWYDCVRFANWLHNGQRTGEQDATTTEDGAYTFTGETSVGDRNVGATVFLPNENEWYKAAYYKGGGTNAGYWDYATQSDTRPDNNPPSADSGNSANYYDYDESRYAVGPPYYSTDVGAYTLSESGYGTFDQSGNLVEWNETLVEPGRRGQRDTFWGGDASYMAASFRDHTYPTNYDHSRGFRVAAIVPEPSTITLLAMGCVALLSYVWRRYPWRYRATK